MTKPITSPNLPRRSLGLVICSALALQAFLAAYGTAFAIGRAGVDPLFVICHGADGLPPGTDGLPPGNGDTENSEKAPCALCAVAAAAGGLLNDAVVVTCAPLVVCSSVAIADQTTSVSIPGARAGLSRAPPLLA